MPPWIHKYGVPPGSARERKRLSLHDLQIQNIPRPPNPEGTFKAAEFCEDDEVYYAIDGASASMCPN